MMASTTTIIQTSFPEKGVQAATIRTATAATPSIKRRPSLAILRQRSSEKTLAAFKRTRSGLTTVFARTDSASTLDLSWLSSKPDSKSPTLAQSFFALPLELQIHILAQLDARTLISVSKANRQFCTLVKDQEAYLVRRMFPNYPQYHTKLYGASPTYSHLTFLDHTAKLTREFSESLATQVMKEMLGRQHIRTLDRDLLNYVHHRLSTHMWPLVFSLHYFLDVYGARQSTVPNRAALSEELINSFPQRLLLRIHLMWHLLLHLIFRRFRSTFPLWRQERPENEVFARILTTGGIPALKKFYEIKGYHRRRIAIRMYLTKYPVKDDQSVPQLTEIWTPSAEKILLEKNLIPSLEHMGCCGLFIRAMLGEPNTPANAGEAGNTQGIVVDENAIASGTVPWVNADETEPWDGEDIWDGEADSDDEGEQQELDKVEEIEVDEDLEAMVFPTV